MDINDRCFEELASEYVLDGLDAAAQQWMGTQVETIPELAGELAALQATMAALSYAAPPLPMANNLKERLFARIGVDMPASTPENPLTASLSTPLLEPLVEPLADPDIQVIRSHSLRWKPHQVPKVMVARLHVDRAARQVVALMRAEPGMQYPAHRHGGTEEIYMLSGDLWFGEEKFGPGDYIRSHQGSRHGMAHSIAGCMFLVRSSMDNEYEEVSTNL